jgi:hypothetical protein
MHPMSSVDRAPSDRRRRRRLRGPIALAATVSLLGVSAVATSASGATNASQSAAQASTAAGNTAKRDVTRGLVTGEATNFSAPASDGTQFTQGHFVVDQFRMKRGVLYAVGHLTGNLSGKTVSRHVSWPVTAASANETASGPQGFAAAPQQVPTPGACSILTLTLGPLDLNLLGLHVALNQVNLLIEAIPAAGNLLGNLLCAVANLLNGGLGGPLAGLLTAITNLLNGLLGSV